MLPDAASVPPDPSDDGYLRAAVQLVRVTRRATAHINRVLSPFGLNLTRYGILLLLAWAEPGSYTMSKLAGEVLLHPAGVTSAIGRLEAEGLVIRSLDNANRRQVIVDITPAGRELADAATREAVARVTLGLTSAQVGELTELVQRLREGMPGGRPRE